MKKVRLFNAKFSPNLGDGLLAECMEKGLVEFGFDPQTTYSIDVAARTSFQPGKRTRGLILYLLHFLPTWIRSKLLSIPLTVGLIQKWRPHYQQLLADADALVIGGGNLFTDFDLNFPTKIAAVVREANRRKIPVYIYGVGCGSYWSEKGKRLVTDALKSADVRYLSMRDEESKRNFDALFSVAVKKQAEIVRDPGLLASRYLDRHHGAQPKTMVGLCVMSAIAVNYHSDVMVGRDFLLHWYEKLYQLLVSAGYQVGIFTNGSPEDISTAHQLVARLTSASPKAIVYFEPKTPTELVSFIAECASVIAFRMHALIAAYSTGAEIIALKWDSKVDAFMKSIDLGDRVFSATETAPEEILSLMRQLNIYHTRAQLSPRAAIIEAHQHLEALANALKK